MTTRISYALSSCSVLQPSYLSQIIGNCYYCAVSAAEGRSSPSVDVACRQHPSLSVSSA